MFTGLITHAGTIASALPPDGGRLAIATDLTAAAGASVAVNGACLTVVTCDNGLIEFDVIAETVANTTLATLGEGATVNLEPALKMGDELGGHWVQGHVDGVGTVAAAETSGDDANLDIDIDLPAGAGSSLLERGSITVDGVSLTVMGLDGDRVRISLIPETRTRTSLSALAAGDVVNIELDVLGRYVEAAVRRALADR